jgi:hypothetical protein
MGENGTREVLCPSARPEMPGSMVFGVVAGTADEPRVAWLERPVPVTEELLAMTRPVPATQVLRFAAPCAEGACCHFNGKDCTLAQRLVQLMPAVDTSLPPCQVRRDCRWFTQEGKAACLRCPQVVTYSANPTPELSMAAFP